MGDLGNASLTPVAVLDQSACVSVRRVCAITLCIGRESFALSHGQVRRGKPE